MAQIEQTEIEQSDNPYVGPRSFTREEAHLYFGREREARDLIALVISQRLVLFYAQSGAGKSSLINTKIIPGLEVEGYEVLPVGRVSGHSAMAHDESNIFAHNLMFSLNQKGDIEADIEEMSLTHFLDNLVFSGGDYYVDEEYEYAEDEELKPRALLIDQFEEIFTSHPEAWQQRDGFFEQLSQAVEDDPDLIVLLSMREDFVARLSPFRHLLPDGLRTRYYMQRMMAGDALKAIRGPVETKEVNRPFTPGVAEKLVENLQLTRSLDQDGETILVTGEYVEPVQLQVVCHQLWENLEHNDAAQITMEDVNALVQKVLAQRAQAGAGRLDDELKVADSQGQQEEEIDPLAIFIDQALGDFYEQALAKALSSSEVEIEEAFLREWFSKKLITEGGSRGILNRGKDYTADMPDEIIKLLLEEYIIRSETRAGATWIELVHDRFVQPIREANQAWTEQRILATPWVGAAHRWKNNDEDEDLLLRDGLLDAALEEAGDLNQQPQLIKRFLQKSQQAQARKEQDQTRRRNFLLSAAAVVLVIGLLIIGFLLYQSDTANKDLTAANEQVEKQSEIIEVQNEELKGINEELGDKNRELGVINEELGDKNRELGVETDRANEQTDIAHSLRLMDLARRHLAEGNIKGALLASLEAYTTSPTPDTRTMLLEALDAVFEPHGSQSFTVTELDAPAIPAQDALLSMAFSPDGQYLVLGGPNGNLLLWDRLQNQVFPGIDASQAHGDNDILGLAWHPTMPIFASASGASDERADIPENNVLLWTLQDGTFESLPLAQDVGSVFDLAFSRDGNLLAAGNHDGSITIWDLSGSEPVLSNTLDDAHFDWVWSLDFSPVDDRLISGGRDGQVLLWFSTGVENEEPVVLDGHFAWVSDMLFNSDATLIASVGDDNQIIVWDVSTDPPTQMSIFNHGEFSEEVPLAASFLPTNDNILITAGIGTRLAFWNIESGELLFENTESGYNYEQLLVDPQNPSTLVGIGAASAVPIFWDVPLEGEPKLANPLALTLQGEGELVPGWTGIGLPLLSDGSIHLWTAVEQSPISQTLSISESLSINSAAFSREDSLLATASPGNIITLWQLEPDTLALPLDTIEGDASEKLSALVFNQAGTMLAAAFCRPSTPEQAPGDQESDDQGAGGPKTSPATSDSQALTSGPAAGISPVTCRSNLIRVWEIAPDGALGEKTQQIDIVDPHSIVDLAFLPDASMDSSTLLLTDSNGDLSVSSDLSSVMEPLRITAENQDQVLRNKHVTTIPDENVFVSAGCIAQRQEDQKILCQGGFVQLWDIESLEPLGPPMNIASDEVRDVEWLPKTGNLTTLDDNGRLTWWESDVNIWQELACLHAGRNMTFEEWTLAFPDSADEDGEDGDLYVTCEQHGYGRHITFAEFKLIQAELELRQCQDQDMEVALELFDEALDEANGVPEYEELNYSEWAADILLEQATTLMISSPLNNISARACLKQSETLPGIEPPDVDATMDVLLALANSREQLRLDDYTNALEFGKSAYTAYSKDDTLATDLKQSLAELIADLCFRAPEDGSGQQVCTELTSLLSDSAVVSGKAERSTTSEKPLWFFTAEVGDVVTIGLTGASVSFDPDLNLRDSSGAVIASNNDSGEGYKGYDARISEYFIQEKGTYFIQVGQPDSREQYTLNLSTLQPASIVEDEERFSTTGAQSLWTFEGHAGDILSIAMETDDFLEPNLTLLGPDGQYLTDSVASGPDYDRVALDYLIRENGNHFIRANLSDGSARYTLLLTRIEPNLLVEDQPRDSTTVDDSMWLFTGNVGDVVTIELISSSEDYDPYLYLLDAAGEELDRNDDSGEGLRGYDSRIADFILPATGDYLVQTGRPGSTVPYRLTLAVDIPQPLSLPARQDLSAGPSWSFPGVQGQTLRIALEGESSTGRLTLIKPDGTLAIEHLPGILTTLDASGTYIVAVQGTPIEPGLSFLIVEEVTITPIDLDYDSPEDGRLNGLEADYWTFDGSTDQPVEIIVEAENAGILVTLYGPDGEQMALSSGPDEVVLIRNIPIAGPYMIVVHGAGEETTADYTISLEESDAILIPQACEMFDTVDYGPIDVGSIVILGQDREVNGVDMYDGEAFIIEGWEAEVVDLAGTDGEGCPLAIVYTDEYDELEWRIRDMTLVEP